MDNPAQNDQNQDQTQSTVQPASPQGGPISPPQKEQEAPVGDYLKASEVHPEISKEIQEAGVETVSEAPQITVEHKKAGLEPAKESVPVQPQPQGLVNLPMTQIQAQNVLKFHKKVTDSIAWLAMLILRQLKLKEFKTND